MPRPSLPRTVKLTGPLRVQTKNTWEAVLTKNHPPKLFSTGTEIVWLFDADGQVTQREVTATVLKRFATDRIDFLEVRYPKKGDPYEVAVTPRLDLFQNMLAGPPPRLPYLRGRVRLPAFGQNGLITKPGYSPDTQFYYAREPGLEIPEVPTRPTPVDVEVAKSILVDELLPDFPFVDLASLAHALAALILPFVRPIVAGPTPLHLIIKPTPGTGGTLLAEQLMYPSGIPRIVNPSDQEAEQRRAIFGELRTLPTSIVLDNVTVLKGTFLSSLMTSLRLSDRIVGSSTVAEVPNYATWLATGNNPELSKEVARRSIPIRLDAGMEHPDQRTIFKHDIESWAVENRGQIIWSALTLVQHWIQQGKPRGTRTLGKFQQWSTVIGGILDACGIEGFLENLSGFRGSVDRSTGAFLAFVEAWAEKYGLKEVRVADLMKLPVELDLGPGNDKSQRIRLGKLLADRQGQRFDDYVVKKGKVVSGRQHWRLVLVEEVDVVDSSKGSSTESKNKKNKR